MQGKPAARLVTVPAIPLYFGTSWYRRYRGTRERNLLALPTLDMYLPLSKFESIH